MPQQHTHLIACVHGVSAWGWRCSTVGGAFQSRILHCRGQAAKHLPLHSKAHTVTMSMLITGPACLHTPQSHEADMSHVHHDGGVWQHPPKESCRASLQSSRSHIKPQCCVVKGLPHGPYVHGMRREGETNMACRTGNSRRTLRPPCRLRESLTAKTSFHTPIMLRPMLAGMGISCRGQRGNGLGWLGWLHMRFDIQPLKHLN